MLNKLVLWAMLIKFRTNKILLFHGSSIRIFSLVDAEHPQRRNGKLHTIKWTSMANQFLIFLINLSLAVEFFGLLLCFIRL